MKCTVCNVSEVSAGHYCCTACEEKQTAWRTSSTNGVEAPADIQMLEAARVLTNQREYKKAVAFYKEACTRLPNRADAHREMAVLLLHQSLQAWLPWEKTRLAREAALAAGRAESIGDMHGDCLFIAAEVAITFQMQADAVPGMLQEAFARYQLQMDRGEEVTAFYFGTALRLGQINEVMGRAKAALAYYEVVAGGEEWERTGRVRVGSVTPAQVEGARATIARLQGVAGEGGLTWR